MPALNRVNNTTDFSEKNIGEMAEMEHLAGNTQRLVKIPLEIGVNLYFACKQLAYSLAVVEQQVTEALKKYDVINGTNSFEEMREFQDKNATMTESNRSSNAGVVKNNTRFFQSSGLNASAITASLIELGYRRIN